MLGVAIAVLCGLISIAGGRVAPPPPGGGDSYFSEFTATENPISEGGMWINGGTTGLDWNNVRTANGAAYGTTLIPEGYADNWAVLTNHTISVDHEVEVVIYRPDLGYSGTNELELLLRASIEPHEARGYEVLVGYAGLASDIVRWNGDPGDFTPLGWSGTGFSSMTDGDVVRAKIVGSTITVYQNDVQVMTVTDSTWSDGSPGMGFFLRAGELDKWGMKSWSAQDAT